MRGICRNCSNKKIDLIAKELQSHDECHKTLTYVIKHESFLPANLQVFLRSIFYNYVN